MNVDALLLLQRSDVAAVRERADAWRGVPLVCIDPGLLDDALAAGLDAGALDYRPLPVGRRFQSRIATEAMTRALRVDQALALERERLLGEGEFLGWDHVPMRFLFLRALVARRLGELCARAFSEARIGLLRPRATAQFYFDSFVAVDAFAQASDRFVVADAYDAVQHRVEDASARCHDFDWIAARAADGVAVVHVPTVWSHLPHYVREIGRAFARTIELPSALWDVPLSHDRCPMRALSTVRVPPEAETYRERARAVLAMHLADLGSGPAGVAAQADALADHGRLQVTTFLGLRDALAGTRPHLVVTEHDTGFVGPLFSVAHALGAPVTVLPHSSYPTQPLPHPHGVTAVERDGFGSIVRTVAGEPVRTRAFRLALRGTVPARAAVRGVCLLVNTLASRGISHVDLAGLAAFHRRLAEACARHGATLAVRLKPGAACLAVAAPALGVPAAALQAVLDEPIDRLAGRVDLCVAYGELTSAAIEFMEAGALVLHVSEECRPTDLTNASALSTMTSLPALDGEAAVRWIDAVLADPMRWGAVLSAQRAEYERRLVARSDRVFD
jgi:hypothetical protein